MMLKTCCSFQRRKTLRAWQRFLMNELAVLPAFSGVRGAMDGMQKAAFIRRICEGCVYYRLEHAHGINPIDLEHSTDKAKLKMLQTCPESKRFRINFHPQFMGLDNGRYALLNVLDIGIFGEDFGTFFAGEIRSMTSEGRDKTIVAHGMEPVSKEDARKCIPAAERVLTVLIPETLDKMKEYPFRKEYLTGFLSLL